MKNQSQLSYHLLPTEDAKNDSVNGLLITNGRLHKPVAGGEYRRCIQNGSTANYLYLTSDAPMKDGDWGIDIGGTEDAEAVVFKFWAKGTEDDDKNDEDFKKIEFTTDPKLIADGVPAIDGKTKARIQLERDGENPWINEVNFLTEFCKRYNQKDNQKAVDIEKLAYSECIRQTGTDNPKWKSGFIAGYQSNAGGLSLEDINNFFGKQLFEYRNLVREAKTSKEQDRRLVECDMISYLKLMLQSSLTKEQPKADIVIECEMEEYTDGNAMYRSHRLFQPRLNKDGQPTLIFK